MGERANLNIVPLLGENNRLVDRVYFVNLPTGFAMLTQNMVAGQRFHPNEIVYNVGGIQYRIMNPAESKLAVALCAGLRHLYVKPGTNVLYLARDASAVVTISHLSDIVGTDGNVYAAFEHVGDIGIGIMVESLNQRSNVHILDGADTTNAARCKDLVASHGKTINVIYCDVGRVDQVDCLFYHASTIMESGGHFVALIKANNLVYKHNREIDTIILGEMSKLEEHRFKRVEALTLGRLAPEWCCIAGLFNPLNCMAPNSEGSASVFADPLMVRDRDSVVQKHRESVVQKHPIL